jgi:hypothetical protein
MSRNEPASWEKDSSWAVVYRTGGFAALVALAFIPIQLVIFVVSPPPETALGHLNLLQENWFRGLLGLDLLYGVFAVLPMGLLTLALCIALRRTHQSQVAIALFLGIVSTAVYFASNVAFDMLWLSDRYAAAATEVQRASLVAASEAMLATYHGTAYDVYYVLGGIVGLTLAFVMLRSGVFSKLTAYTGLVMNTMMLVPATAGALGMFLAVASLIPTTLWLVLVARRLFVLGRTEAAWEPSAP